MSGDSNVMNILFYMPSVMIGGVRTVTEILTRGFEAHGHNVFWLCHNRVYENGRDFPSGFNLVYLPGKELLAADNVKFFNDLLEANAIDVVVNQDGLYEGSELIAKANKSILNLSVIHNNPLLNYEWLFKDISTLRDASLIEKAKRIGRILFYGKIKKQVFSSLLNRFAFLSSHSSTVVFLSPKYIDSVRRHHLFDKDAVSIANPNTYCSPRLGKKEKEVLYVGRIDNRSKKIQYLIEIWKKLGEATNGWKLSIVGEGKDLPTVRKMAEKCPNIEFLGYKSPEPFYQRSAIVCMTSLFEGFPMVLTEAMQHGCVPIAFDSFPAVYDIISSGKDGEIVKAFNKKEFARRLLHLMNNDIYRQELSHNAIESVKRFDCENIVAQWEKLFGNVLPNNK